MFVVVCCCFFPECYCLDRVRHIQGEDQQQFRLIQGGCEKLGEYSFIQTSKEKGSTEKSSPGKKQALKKAEKEWQVMLNCFKV